MSRRHSTSRIWTAPAALGLASVVGLVAALLADGIGDVVSWLALAAPVAVIGWHVAVSTWRRAG